MTNLVVGDADALIALAFQGDANHARALAVAKRLSASKCRLIYPNTAILEAVTALARKLSLPENSLLLNDQYRQGALDVFYVTQEVQARASEIFAKFSKSKANTLFDAVVVAIAEKLGAQSIFSFDKWYLSLGHKLSTE